MTAIVREALTLDGQGQRPYLQPVARSANRQHHLDAAVELTLGSAAAPSTNN